MRNASVRSISVLLFSAFSATTLWMQNAIANECYTQFHLTPPMQTHTKVLNIFVDQTMPLTSKMKTSIMSLVSNWGSNGEKIRIARLSANIKGQFTELMFDNGVDIAPSQEYLYHLRKKDNKSLLSCLAEQKIQFQKMFKQSLSKTLNMTDASLPKTDLFFSLRELATQLLTSNAKLTQSVLIISDGLENSDYMTFHRGRTIKQLKPKKILNKLAKLNLIPNWYNAKIYMYGLGYIRNSNVYIRPKIVEPLKQFWKNYFLQGNGDVVQLGTPELLLSSIQ